MHSALTFLHRCAVLAAIALMSACAGTATFPALTSTTASDATTSTAPDNAMPDCALVSGGYSRCFGSQWLAYLSQGPYGLQCNPLNTRGIELVTSSSRVLGTLPIDSFVVGLDDAGNVYDLNNMPSTEGCGIFRTGATLERYRRGALSVDASYQVAPNTYWISVSGQGEVAALTATVQQDGALDFAVGFWNPDKRGGPPSYTIDTLTDVCLGFVLAHDGSAYLQEIVNGASLYAVYAPGSATPARTIPEKIVPPNQQANFCANYMAVGADGTLYVTEYTFFQPDPLAGLYIYYPDGRERFAATTADSNGPGPEGVDVDAAGNIYVANNNSAAVVTSSGALAEQSDSLHDVEIFSPGGQSVLRHIRGDFDPIDVGVTPDGVLFFGSYGLAGVPTPPVYGTFGVAAGSTTAIRVAPNSEDGIVFYNGLTDTTTSVRQDTSAASVGSAHGGGAGALRARLLPR
jgi:hypothetical protein